MKLDSEIQVIAEIGCNHLGDMDIACRMIETAAGYCGAQVAKFQKRHNRSLLPPDVYNRPHPVPANSYGRTYGEHREYLEFSVGQHRELQQECRRHGIEYSTSVWDLTSAQEIAALKPSMIKVPSATNLNYDVQEYLCRNFDGMIHVSTGMTTGRELSSTIEFYEKMGRAQDLVIYACTSGYPVPFDEVCLLEINRLQDLYGERIAAVGFSGHHIGTAVDMAAVAVGMSGEARFRRGPFKYIERHFTLDCSWKGTDHAASLEPDGLRQLCDGVRDVSVALNYKEKEILDVEVAQRHKLKWRETSANETDRLLLNKVS
ncbi:N-acetylneuraminate synthase family protein [Roseibium sp. MMSF_3412]|uniref:N-acetylneuraminate synthase family protein n=1 Tax=Roseibium sp. MMSF_3412 TaxID=3046712 RepID=UPI00273F426C|nr:N-acetylneuraminate synthase family protein [Roseibium sp. MMSF_3412]